MRKPRMRWTLGLAAEVALALGLCVVAYGLFLGLLGIVFPSSAGLQDLIGAAAASRVAAVPEGGVLSGSGSMADVKEAPARLEVLSPRVTRKQADAVAWVPANTGTRLRGRDGVQTAARGAARIDFGGANRLQLGPNTLVIIRETVEEVDRPARQASVLMLEGELWADVGAHGRGHAMTLQVSTPSGVARVAPSGDAQARMRVSVDDDRASTFAVYEGEASVHTKDGAVRVTANQAVAVDSAGGASAPRALPAVPAPGSPAPGARISFRDAAPPVTFTWRAVPGATGYRFTLARDAAFRDVVVTTDVAGTAFRQQGIAEGVYHWRVSARDGVVEGAASAARTLRLERAAAGGPPLDVAMPPSVVRGDRVVVQGVTSPSSRVVIADDAVRVDASGRFRHEVKLQPGMNVIVVEAVSRDGVSTYTSAIVNAKP